ncbi:MAG: hypothetical protein H7836_16410 [Magnetococcus sp. YQC-3]
MIPHEKDVYNSLNAEKMPRVYETSDHPSQTVPDQTMSLKTILERYARGLPIEGVSSEPIYEGEDGVGFDLRTLDLSEREEMAQRVRNELSEIETRIKKQKSDELNAQLRAQIKKEIEEEQSQNAIILP